MNADRYRAEAAAFADALLADGSKGTRRRFGSEVRGRCPRPAHEDRAPSFGFNEERDCWSCSCGNGKGSDLRRELGFSAPANGIARTAPAPVPPPPKQIYLTLDAAAQDLAVRLGKTEGGRWSYANADGSECFSVLRFDGEEEGKDGKRANVKAYRPVHVLPGGFALGDPPVPALPLYKLPDLPAASRVLIVEGEKCADAAARLGFTATCSAHGAKAAKRSFWGPLAGKEVFIIPDADAPGRAYAEEVSAILGKLSPPARARIIELPGLAEGEDLADFIAKREAKGRTLDAIRTEIDAVIAKTSPASSPPTYRPFPVRALPEPLSTFTEAASRAIGVDPAMVALPLLAACGSAIGNSRRISPKRGWEEPPVVWSIVIAESGTGKSPALDAALSPLRRIQEAEFRRIGEKLSAFATEKLKHEKALSAWRGNKGTGDPPSPPEEPHALRYLVADVTTEALAPILLHSPRGTLVARDELAAFVRSFDTYHAAQGCDAPRWLELWRAGSLTVDRKGGTPKTIHVPNAAASITGTIQPGSLAKAFGRDRFEDGFAARCLLAYPPRPERHWTEDEIDPAIRAMLDGLFDALVNLAPAREEGGVWTPAVLRFTPAGKAAWIAFFNRHAEQARNLSGDLAAAHSKLEAYCARLALIFQCVRGVSQAAPLDAVDEASVQSAADLVAWFGSEAARVYAVLRESEADGDRRRLVDLVRRRGGSITVRDLRHFDARFKEGPAETANPAARAALDDLARRGWGTWEKRTGEGPHAETFRLAPETNLQSPNLQVSGSAPGVGADLEIRRSEIAPAVGVAREQVEL